MSGYLRADERRAATVESLLALAAVAITLSKMAARKALAALWA